jgi:hypothetical protein
LAISSISAPNTNADTMLISLASATAPLVNKELIAMAANGTQNARLFFSARL